MAVGWRHAVVGILSGCGLGLLTGTLLGLSTSQVVGSVVAALAALLAGFFGLTNAGGEGQGGRIAAFGLACAAAVLFAVWLRAGDRLGRPPLEEVRRWEAAGYDPKEARQLVALQRLGVQPQGVTVAAPAAARGTVLFSGAAPGDCARLRGITDPAELRDAFQRLGGRWALLAGPLASAPPAASLALRDLACGEE